MALGGSTGRAECAQRPSWRKPAESLESPETLVCGCLLCYSTRESVMKMSGGIVPLVLALGMTGPVNRSSPSPAPTAPSPVPHQRRNRRRHPTPVGL